MPLLQGWLSFLGGSSPIAGIINKVTGHAVHCPGVTTVNGLHTSCLTRWYGNVTLEAPGGVLVGSTHSMSVWVPHYLPASTFGQWWASPWESSGSWVQHPTGGSNSFPPEQHARVLENAAHPQGEGCWVVRCPALHSVASGASVVQKKKKKKKKKKCNCKVVASIVSLVTPLSISQNKVPRFLNGNWNEFKSILMSSSRWKKTVLCLWWQPINQPVRCKAVISLDDINES